VTSLGTAKGLVAAIALPWSLATATTPAFAQGSECRDLTPPRAMDPSWADKSVSAEDLVRLRDIGPANNEIGDRPLFSISPDGTQVAFQLRRADPATNSYCFGMFLTDTAGHGTLRQIDAGGEFIKYMTSPFGRTNLPLGVSDVITPRWSPDGRWIAFLKRTGGKTRLWRAFADGSGSQIIAEDPAEIKDFRISENGQAVILQVKSALAVALAGIAEEAKVGFHYDNRSDATISARPLPLAPQSLSVIVIDVASGGRRQPTATEEGLFETPPESAEHRPLDTVPGVQGVLAWKTSDPVFASTAADAIHARMSDGQEATCGDISCTRTSGPMWWTSDGRRVRYMRTEGWANSLTAIYEWTPGETSGRKLYSTDANLIDCQPVKDTVTCLRETSLEPRHLVNLDPASGKIVTLVQPNPEFLARRKGRVERIQSLNELGVAAFADLVYPVGYEAGKTYPLIVVQYRTRGFLRAGVGEEYPIQAFAGDGYAVLSADNPLHIGYRPEAKNYIGVDAISLRDFAQRRSALSSIETVVVGLIEHGIVDPRRIGITGLSDGSSTVQFAALHSKLFTAGVSASCCWEKSQNPLLGPSTEAVWSQIGWPTITQPAPEFWAQVSLAQNPKKLAFPLLMQLSDTEYLPALESYTALRQNGMPVDLFVFPDEYHIKWQPSHRLASFQRSIDWFDFWFKGERPSDARRREEVDRWAALSK
jgi:dipeptidyl aminopeptidase/acylaminoacyl peptidase